MIRVASERFHARAVARWLCLALAVLAAACAGTRDPAHPDIGPLPAPPRASDGSAYVPEKFALAPPVTTSWTLRGDEVDVTLLAPSGRGPFPLIIYLPGLGESSAAGSAWRRAWAEAGYAVLSAQARASGAGAWSGERARSFDFRTVALEHFSARAAAARLATINGIIDEALRRQRTGGDAFDGRIDTTRIAIAGYDLGALSAMIVAGQAIDQPSPPPPVAIRSVIALSPYADFAGMGTEARFRDIRLPVLSVTSPEDTDSYGLVTTAAVRRAPYQYMPPGRKYLLLLAAGPHSLLGGQEHPGVERDENRGRRTEMRPDERATRATPGDGRTARPRVDSGSVAASMPVNARPDINVSWATQLRNVQGVTTAFLDATVKDDGRAADWLAREAQRWLGGSASLQAK